MGLLKIDNGMAVNVEDIPIIPFEEFKDKILKFTETGYVVQHFAIPSYNINKNNSNENKYKIYSVLRNDTELYVLSTMVGTSFESLSQYNIKFQMFEREIAEQYGIVPKNHPWLKSVRYHKNYKGAPDVFGNNYTAPIPGNYPFYEVGGEEIHQVAVGPVHAGIIEPGHFRFNCIGETILSLEIQHGYQHRGIEKQILNCKKEVLPLIIESIAGDTVIGNSICFSEAIEWLSNCNYEANEPLYNYRRLLLEIERIANHIGTMGGLAGDVGYIPTASYYGRIRGDFLNMFVLICGNRFGRSSVRPFGAPFKLSDDHIKELIKRFEQLKKEVIDVGNLMLDNPEVLGRFDYTGIVDTKTAKLIGLVGPAGRASGIKYDVRKSFSKAKNIYNRGIGLVARKDGAVSSRAKTYFYETLDSIEFCIELLKVADFQINDSADKLEKIEKTVLKPNSFIITMEEAWRGELSHCIITDENGNIIRYKIKDPSFHNWTALELVVRNEGIYDFPLCNKSFNLSYCGFDL
ncbi:hydrogenase, component E-formate hydrogenlyase subunit 5-like protein [Methanococcus aeolicus Nankai-3]|uniref:Hydrogenase, component E-formate hydrogenlyase subunit 5-like protein n=1 Tax=Methanococcus aeolicus (strain ATCC BAA-1280 / DSM 17508 / OCM 812 / Nankai-3) TaxID=419665 RepID=A6UVJ6_META3|nr:NADH-quinone oxidoreductase subunit C [Methanococcus aeolicus]ABR56518.1 hydrogenase, component E-formate hydrogenlyase subunit 5-like protein [Methanococcus aeolicus Nankai-3]